MIPISACESAKLHCAIMTHNILYIYIHIYIIVVASTFTNNNNANASVNIYYVRKFKMHLVS